MDSDNSGNQLAMQIERSPDGEATSLKLAINNAELAARSITTPQHISYIAKLLYGSMVCFPWEAHHEFTYLPDGPGLYFFDVKFPHDDQARFTDWVKAWGTRGGADLQKGTSRASLKRASRHLTRLSAGEAVPLYIGKSENLRARVRGHLTGDADSGTYGLKLLSRIELFRECEIRVGAVHLDVSSDGYFFVPLLEAALRKHLHPIVGKQ